MVVSAAAQFDRLPRWPGPSDPADRWVISVSPGVLSVGTHNPMFAERTEERQLARHLDEIDRQAAELTAEIVEFLGHPGVAAGTHPGPDSWSPIAAGTKPRGRIREWSRKSRANMCKVFGQLDYLPMLLLGVLTAITLTYPADWLVVAPDGETVKRHLETFKERWRKEWGKPMALWKMEFQRRGAPHFHLLTALMTRRLSSDGLTFRDWVGVNWAEVVNDSREVPAPEEFRKHLLAGTQVDQVAGMKCRDPRRAAIYFAKHGVYGSKEYQNHPPAEWADSRTVGRFWGVWGLEKAVEQVEVTPETARAAGRVLRGWSERIVNYDGGGWPSSMGLRTQVRTVRRVNTRTGAVSYRRVRRRVRRLRSGRGWVSVNDGADFASELARFLAGPVGESPEDRCARLVAATGSTEVTG